VITTGSKWFLGLGFVSLVLAAAYGWTTGGNGVGPLTMGYKGGVGDHFGYGVLSAAGYISLFLGAVSLAVRDAEALAEAQVAGTDTVPAAIPATPSYWPAVTAFGVALVVVGLVASPVLFVFGLVALGVALVEWAVQTWADRATGDPATNRQIRNRLMNPIEFPAAGLLAIGLVVAAFSRLFLSLSADAAVWVGIGITGVIIVAGFFFASRPRISRNVVVGVLLVAAVVVIGLGIGGAVSGEREFHEPGAEGTTVEEGG
jgi:multidrug transporter EmrE-like cation transporter